MAERAHWIVAFAWVTGCDAPGTTHTASSAAPTISAGLSTAPAQVAPLPIESPPPDCPAFSKRYEIEIRGDGEPLALRAGAPPSPLRERNCEPAVKSAAGFVTLSACAIATDPRHACIWLRGNTGAYLDRDGKQWNLTVEGLPKLETPKAVNGEFTATATIARAAPRTLMLTLKIHVGTDVKTIDAPDVWPKEND